MKRGKQRGLEEEMNGKGIWSGRCAVELQRCFHVICKANHNFEERNSKKFSMKREMCIGNNLGNK